MGDQGNLYILGSQGVVVLRTHASLASSVGPLGLWARPLITSMLAAPVLLLLQDRRGGSCCWRRVELLPLLGQQGPLASRGPCETDHKHGTDRRAGGGAGCAAAAAAGPARRLLLRAACRRLALPGQQDLLASWGLCDWIRRKSCHGQNVKLTSCQ